MSIIVECRAAAKREAYLPFRIDICYGIISCLEVANQVIVKIGARTSEMCRGVVFLTSSMFFSLLLVKALQRLGSAGNFHAWLNLSASRVHPTIEAA